MPHAQAVPAQHTFAEWFKERFRSDPYEVLRYFTPEISDIAELYGIDFQASRKNIDFNGFAECTLQNISQGLVFSDKEFQGSSKLWARKEEAKNGIIFPIVTFNTYKGISAQSWSGYRPLKELYDQECGLEIDANVRTQRQLAIEARQKEHAAHVEKQRKKREAEAQRKQQSVQRDLDAARAYSTFTGPHSYANRKRISDAMSMAGALTITRQHGKEIVLPLHDIHLQPRGLQRIYEKKVQISKEGALTDKEFTWGMVKTGAHRILGDFNAAHENGDPVYFVEGFATGATVLLATGQSVVVALDADNLKVVVREYARCYPDLKIIIAADNDCWKCDEGKGNKGMITALDLSKELQIKAVYPRFGDDMDTVDNPTDWNDVHCIHQNGLAAVTKMLKSPRCRLKAENGHFDYLLQRLAFTSQHQAKKDALAAINAGMTLVPLSLTSKEVVQQVISALPSSITLEKNGQSLKQRAKWLAMKKVKDAKSLRSFSKETLERPHVQYHKTHLVRNKDGHQVVGPDVLRMVEVMKGPVVIRMPMATGKTKAIIAPLIQQSIKGAYFAHRVSLIADACNRLSDKDNHIEVKNYQRLTPPMMPFVHQMGCCINSITHPKFNVFMESLQDVFIDEACQTLRHTAEGDAVDNPVAVLKRLTDIMRKAHRVVMCDADANDDLIDFIEQEMPGETIHIIEAEADCSHIQVLHTSQLMAEHAALEAAKAGKKVLVASDGAGNAETLATTIKTACPQLKVLFVNSDSKSDTEVEQFLENPNKECFQWDVVIYSPTISSGFSIEKDHFDVHIGIFLGVVIPSDAIQMLRRDRTANQFIVGFRPNSHQRETDREQIYRGLVEADRQSAFEMTEDGLIQRWQKQPFDEVRLATLENVRRGLNDYANIMLLMLIADGYDVGMMERNPLKEEASAEYKKASKQIVKQARVDLVMSLDTPGDEEAARLRWQDVNSREDNAKLKRYAIEHELCAPVEEEHILFLEDQGLKKLSGFEILQADPEQCADYDNQLVRKGVVLTRRSNKKARHKILRILFEKLGIDPLTGIGSFGQKTAQEAMQAILCSDEAVAMYNEVKVGAYANPKGLPKCATTFAKNILAKLGLATKVEKTSRKKLRRHVIDPESWEQLSAYYHRRQAAGISSLTLSISDDEQSSAPTETHPPALPIDFFEEEIAGDAAEEGGAALYSEYITLETNPLHPPVARGDYTVALDGADPEQLAGALWAVAEAENLPIAQTVSPDSADLTGLLVFLVMEVQELLRHKPNALENYPELTWIDWKANAV